MNEHDTSAELRAMINKAMKQNGHLYTYEDVLRAIDAGRMQLWPIGESSIVTEIIQYPQKKCLNILLVAGRLQDFLDFLTVAEKYCLERGIDQMVGNGRKGFGKVLPEGWEEVTRTFVKKVSPIVLPE